MKKAFYILLIPLFLETLATFAQSPVPCEDLLRTSEQLYESGNYDLVISQLENGLKTCNLSHADKERALVLMIRSQIEKDNPEQTDQLVYRLLTLSPNYSLPDPAKASTFNNALLKYNVRPLLSIGIRGGVNFPYAHIERIYSVLTSADYARKYSSRPGVTAGIHVELEFYKNLSLCLDPAFTRISYNRNITGEQNWNLKFTETMSSVEQSFALKYTYPVHSFRFGILSGYVFQSISKAQADVDLKYTAYNAITETFDPYQSAANKIDLKSVGLREKNFNSVMLGLTAGYKTGNTVFSLGVQYYYSKDNLVSSDHRYDSRELLFDFYYIDNDFDINQLMFRAGIDYIFFHKIRKNS